MKVLITGGQNEADFIIKMFKEAKHQLIVVNSDQKYCQYLSKENHIKVYIGDPTQISVLHDAGAMDCDLAIALCPNDEDNFVICQISKNNKCHICIHSGVLCRLCYTSRPNIIMI